MLRHLFFDLDNTLWDHRKNAQLTLRELFAKEKINAGYGLSFEDFYREYYTVNENLWALIRDGKIDKEYLRAHRFYDTFQFFGIEDAALADRFEHQFLDEILGYNELVPGTVEILTYLREKEYQLHILSNGFAEVTDRKCELSGIKPFFRTITSGDEINMRKPHPEIYAHALAKAQAQPEESMMIGDDWIADVEGAKAYGITPVFFDVFRDGASNPEIITIEHLSELKQHL